MKARSYFLSLSTSVIILNIIICLGAIFLVERIIPAINNIIDENAFSVTSSVNMLQTVSSADLISNPEDVQKNQVIFWTNFENAKKNITLKSEIEIINHIEFTAKDYWAGNKDMKANLTESLVQLANVNLKDMKKKELKAENISLTGAWAVGILLIFSVGIQLVLRGKILNGLILPLEGIASLLQDYKNGNSIRRFTDQRGHLNEIRQTGVLINNILDSKDVKKK